MPFRFLAPLAACLALLTPAAAQRNLTNIPDPDPELERQTFRLPDGFEAQLFASDPVVKNPVQMNFDPAGRLWVVTSEMYPHLKPGETPSDKIIILEDTDGDGVSDKHTVFADGLFIPTGIVPGDRGCYVANSTELLHLSDTDGDGKADRTRVILSGFGTEDTHHLLHTLRWGPEGLLYFNQSIYIHSHVETPFGVKRLLGGGIWRFRPETLELHVHLRGLINPWGHQFDKFGQSFATDGAGGEGINYVIPGAAYPTAVGVSRILHGFNPGSPKHCGLGIASGRHLPDDWQGDLLTCDFRGHRVCRFKLERSGSGYVSREQDELITSDHVAFRPIDVLTGPDGAIYVADWYNPIIQHGEVDFRDERRDRTHGRIWRIVNTNRETLPNPNLTSKTIPDLLGLLNSPERWTRENAKRLLKARGADAVFPSLQDLTSGLLAIEQTDERYLLELLWVHEALRLTNRDLLKRLLTADDPRVRAGAVRVLSHSTDEFDDTVSLLSRAATDSDPQVRLEAVRALGQIPTEAAVLAAVDVASQPMDKWLEYAFALTIEELQPAWSSMLASGDERLTSNPQALLAIATAAGGNTVTDAVMKQLRRDDLKPDVRTSLISVLTRQGGPAAIGKVLSLFNSESITEADRLRIASELLASAQPKSPYRGDVAPLAEALQSTESTVLRHTIRRLLGRWKREEFRDEFAGLLLSDAVDVSERMSAAQALAEFGGPRTLAVFRKVAESAAPADLRAVVISEWVRLNPQAAATFAVKLFADDARSLREVRVESVTRAFLAQRGAADRLAAALSDASIDPDVARVALRTVSGGGRAQPKLSEALVAAGSLATSSRKMSPEEIVAFVADVRENGNPARGEEIYHRESLACTNCHAIGAAGGRVGPDLISLGGSAQPDYVLQSLLEPNAKVKEGYQTLVVATEEGVVHNGIKLRESDSELVLRTAKDEEIVIAKNTIEETADGTSIMPKDLVTKLTRSELVDLVRFLSDLGRTPKYTLPKTPFVRRFEVMSATPEAAYRLRRTRYGQATTDDEAFAWRRRFARVDGSLPLSALPEVTVRNRSAPGSRGVSFLRFEVVARRAGEAGLLIDDGGGLQVWIGDEPLAVAKRIPVALKEGVNRVTVAVDQSQRRVPLRIEIDPGTADATPVGGK